MGPDRRGASEYADDIGDATKVVHKGKGKLLE
mgnify:CR=1 FL=1